MSEMNKPFNQCLLVRSDQSENRYGPSGLMTSLNTTEAVRSAVAQQARRRRELTVLIKRQVLPFIKRIEDEVVLDLGPHEGDSRLVLWVARCLIRGDESDRRVADGLIASLKWEARFHFNAHFVGMAAMLLLLCDKECLSAAAIANLEGYVLRYLSDWMTDDFRIHGANDNAGIECAATVALAGEYWHNAALIEFARDRLQRPLRLLGFRDYLHECNSPTYSACSLTTLAELAETTRDATLREMALQLEGQVWREVLTHFHPVIRHQIGPFSRTFADDSANQCSLVMMALYCAFGEVSPFNPKAMLFPPPSGTFAHNSWTFQWASLVYISAASYHPPDELAARSFDRATPFEIRGSNEFSPMGKAPGGQSTVQASVEADWALSCFGSRPLAGTSVHALYRRCEVAPEAPVSEHLAAVRSIYTRCQVSGSPANFHLRDAAHIESELAADSGAAFAVQQEGVVLLGYVPLAHGEEIRTIRSSIIFPLHHSRPDEIWHGRHPVTGFSASFSHLDWCFIRDGDIYLGFYPLLSERRSQTLAVQQYGAWEDYGTVSAYNMSDLSAHKLEEQELRAYGSGFVMEIASARQGLSFEEFCEQAAAGQIVQEQRNGQRELRYARDHIELELIYDYHFLSLRRAAAGGRLVDAAHFVGSGKEAQRCHKIAGASKA